jgi:hypothetical protein
MGYFAGFLKKLNFFLALGAEMRNAIGESGPSLCGAC